MQRLPQRLRVACGYPNNLTRQQKKDVKELMSILSQMYLCKECADHFKEVLRSNPVQARFQAEFSQWLCHVHNVVNRSSCMIEFAVHKASTAVSQLSTISDRSTNQNPDLSVFITRCSRSGSPFASFNRSLVFPCERVGARWGELECEQRACDLQGTTTNFGNDIH
ncbi:FAD-linked sulfhydryl oxidase ERV1-like [Cornus florida]|uniref:FAD-linked sulfhydryl oxidase ERV1-like n=1 Tax=Cornus florida TaxID=4283 RepID=UPI00289DE3CB|nr:FAD-linked sulfhydryl oxidase ERV1-like [Cornus florida]